MRGRGASFVLTVILVVGSFTLALTIVPENARAATLFVGGSGPGNYTTIQLAIDDADPGDTVFVYAGTYTEGLRIRKPISLVGEQRDTTIIIADWELSVIRIDDEPVNVTGFTLKGGISTSYGFYIVRADNSNIVNNRVENTGSRGIDVFESNNVVIADNILSGIDLFDIETEISDNITIAGNTMTDSPRSSAGVILRSTSHVKVTNNVMEKNGIFIEGDLLPHWNTHIIDASNVVDGRAVTYWKNMTGGVVPLGTAQVILANCSNVVVEDRRSENITAPIQLGHSSWNTVRNNTLISTGWMGLRLSSSDNNQVIDNKVSSSSDVGIHLYLSNGNNVSSNDANEVGNGIRLEYSNGNTIEYNSFSRNWNGPILSSSHNNIVSRNSVTRTSRDGMIIAGSNNIIANNTVWNDWNEIDPYYISDKYDGINDAGSHNILWNNSISNTRMGIFVNDATYSTLVNNKMINNGIYMWGDLLDHWNTHTIDTSNLVNGKPVYYWKNLTGGTVPLGAGQVILSNCSNVVVENQDIHNTSSGIKVGFSTNVTIANSTVFGSHWDGVGIYSSSDSKIVNNEISDNIEWGIWHSASDRSIIDGNKISNTIPGFSRGAGIEFWQSYDSIISKNILMDNRQGINLYSSSSRNTIVNNTLDNIWFGISLYSGTSLNNVYHNSIMNHQRQAFDIGVSSRWDNRYPSGGNYWSDYTGVDNCSGPNQDICPDPDGIGDTPYVIDSDSRDYYPLMSPMIVVPLKPPSALQASLSGLDFQNVTLSWLPSRDDGSGTHSVVGYRIYRNTTFEADGSGYELIASIPNGTTEFTDVLVGEGDPQNYFYRLCAIDSNNSTSCAENQAGKFTRSLLQGHNLVSIPLVQLDWNIATILQTLKWDMAWNYDSSLQEWKWHMGTKPYQRGLNTLPVIDGVWTTVLENSNLTVAGVLPSTTSIQLHQGWNLVGFPSFKTSYTVGDLKADTGATRVEGYDSSSSPYHLRLLSDFEVLEPGHGYWIKVEVAANWTVSVG